MNQKTLTWYGPHTFKKHNFLTKFKENEEFNKPGVYMWTYKIKDIHYVHYIGMAKGNGNIRPIKERLNDHFTKIIAGNNWIYDFNCLQRLVCEMNDKKMDYFNTQEFEQYKGKGKDTLGIEYLENLSFFVCPLEDNLNDIGDIEKFLISKVAIEEGLSAKIFFINDTHNKIDSATKYFDEAGTRYICNFPKDISVDSLNC